MIVSRIEGGLGNQMFQYAYGWYLARRHNCPLWLDINSYQAGPEHGYLLDRLQISARVATGETLRRIPARYRSGSKMSPGLRLTMQLLERWTGRQLRRHKESPFGFHPKYLDSRSGCYVVGYWQSESFFPGMRDELLQQFRPRTALSDASQSVLDRIRTTHSLALHIRRGDYLTNSDAARIYSQLDRTYYQAAIDAWARGLPQADLPPEIFIFSNDIPWCRQQFALNWKTHFVEHNTATSAHEDMVLMSAAHSCAIANSTFSWWGAWLNQRAGHVIYAPSPWFLPGTLDASNILPDRWISDHWQPPMNRGPA